MLPSIIQDNFLDNNLLDSIAQTVLSANNIYQDYQSDKQLHSHYYTWKFYNPNFRNIHDSLLPLFQEHSKLKLIVDHSHILDSCIPYKVHTDYYQHGAISKLNPAYTIIVPLETCPTHTIAFNQSSKIKGFVEYCQTENPEIISKDLRISKETRQQYLSHVSDNLLDYLTIKEIFAWKKGSAYFCDRKYFHCSDNYIAQGLTNKRALVFWTSVIET